uniref:Chemokine interleukin-8-like domain-containing protein n=1 Tax=Oryzias latipes TaxID=8090 RepID=A0A3P9MIP9_ORYLA
MQFALLSSTLLCVIAWMNSIQAVHGHVHDCKCVRPRDTQIPKTKLVSYTIQEESICNVRVVIFTTVKGKILCSDPNSSWTKEGMRTLDVKKAMMEAQRKEAEHNKTPAASTMNPTLTPQTVSTAIPSVSTSTPSVSTVAPTETTTEAAAATSEASTLKPTAAPSSAQTLSSCQKKQKEQNRGNRRHRKSGRQGRNGRKNKGRMKEWQKKNKARKQLQKIFRCKQMLPN